MFESAKHRCGKKCTESGGSIDHVLTRVGSGVEALATCQEDVKITQRVFDVVDRLFCFQPVLSEHKNSVESVIGFATLADRI